MPEIAALSKKYPYGAIDLRSEEQQLTGCLHEYMSSMPEGQQKLLMKAIDMLEIEP
jgi:hypothetical protein